MSVVGSVVAGRFRLERPLGHGGMGEVWVAFDERLAVRCAVKFLQPTSEPEAEARFHREAQTAAQLRSPYVVAMLDHGTSDGRAYIAMELLDGEDLSKRLRRVGKLEASETVRLVTHIGRALSRAHGLGLIHRDLKPANVVVVRDEDGPIAKVLDFGIAKVSANLRVDSAKLDVGRIGDVSLEQTIEGQTLGTPTHMSPEHVHGERLDHRTDLWALGVIAYECVTGQLPFRAKSLGELVSEITAKPFLLASSLAPSTPAAIDAWFERALAKEREARFRDAKEMTDALAVAFGSKPQAGSALSVTPPAALELPAPESLPFARTEAIDTRGRASRRRWPWVLAAALAAGAGVLGFGRLRPSTQAPVAQVPIAQPSEAAAPTPSGATTSNTAPPLQRFREASRVVEITAGWQTTCARFESGRAACWGRDARIDVEAPTLPSGDAVEVFSGQKVRWIRASELAVCAAADGTRPSCVRPFVPLTPLFESGFPEELVLGAAAACARHGREVRCLGLASDSPEVVTLWRDAVTFAANGQGGCSVSAAGKTSCWVAPLGIGDVSGLVAAYRAPKPQPALDGAKKFSVGAAHACGINGRGRVVCLGSPALGVLGIVDTSKPIELSSGSISVARPSPPNVVEGLEQIVDIVSGRSFNCALSEDHRVLCWGANDLGQLGRGTVSGSEAKPALAMEDVAVLGAGSSHVCAVKTNGDVFCWGGGEGMALGHATTQPCGSSICQPTPTLAKPW